MNFTQSQAEEQQRKFDANGRTINHVAETHVTTHAPCDDESKLHDEIETYCREHGWRAIHSRMDRKTTGHRGDYDFVIFADQGRVFVIEGKTKTGKHTIEQLAFALQLNKLGHLCHTVRSFAEFRSIVEEDPSVKTRFIGALRNATGFTGGNPNRTAKSARNVVGIIGSVFGV